jgi:hypothetical protein
VRAVLRSVIATKLRDIDAALPPRQRAAERLLQGTAADLEAQTQVSEGAIAELQHGRLAKAVPRCAEFEATSARQVSLVARESIVVTGARGQRERADLVARLQEEQQEQEEEEEEEEEEEQRGCTRRERLEQLQLAADGHGGVVYNPSHAAREYGPEQPVQAILHSHGPGPMPTPGPVPTAGPVPTPGPSFSRYKRQRLTESPQTSLEASFANFFKKISAALSRPECNHGVVDQMSQRWHAKDSKLDEEHQQVSPPPLLLPSPLPSSLPSLGLTMIIYITAELEAE